MGIDVGAGVAGVNTVTWTPTEPEGSGDDGFTEML